MRHAGPKQPNIRHLRLSEDVPRKEPKAEEAEVDVDVPVRKGLSVISPAVHMNPLARKHRGHRRRSV